VENTHKYLNHDIVVITMSRRISKMTPDNELKSLILTAVSLGMRRSQEIIQHVQSTPYHYLEADNEVTENWYGGDAGAIRTAITRLKNAGYLSLYERNEQGTITSYETQKRPYSYYLTALGRVHEQNPYFKKEHREQRISDEAYRLLRDLLVDEPAFQEAIKEYARTNEVPKINITRTRAPIIRNPRVKAGKGGKITIEMPDGTEQEVTTEELQVALKDIDGIRIRENEHNQTIITQQYTMQGYEQQISDLVYALERKDISLSNIKRRNTGAMRTAQRKDLVYAMTGINPDELDGEYPVEAPVGADFFETWGSIWGRKVKGATLWNRASFELMSDTNPEVERGHANHELNYTEMDAVGMFISKIRPTGITIDSENKRIVKAIALNW